MLRALGRGLGASSALLVGGTAAYVNAKPEDGLSRSIRFWRGMMPVYAHYKYVEWTVKDEEDPAIVSAKYKPLNDKYSPRIRDLTLELQGFYFKLAQVVSTRDEFMPTQYMEWCKKLQDQNPITLPIEEIRDIVQAELDTAGKGTIDDMFSSIEESPIGAASIGQVHRAVLRETGEEVVVKLQYPGVEEKFRNDIATVESFCENFMPQNKPFFNEIKKQFATEFDYQGEAANLELVRSNLIKGGFSNLVEVPKPYSDLCTKSMLVMTYLPGDRLIDGVRNSYRRVAEATGRDFEEMEEEMMEAIRNGTLEMKGLEESVRENQRTKNMLYMMDFVRNVGVFVANWTIAPIWKWSWNGRWEYFNTEVPINLAEILQVLLRVHGHEIFTDGAFNGDPHPGNVLLMPDSRLGLIDYGQVKQMTEEDRIKYAKLILALARDDKDEIVRVMTEEVGFKTRDMNEDVIYRTAMFWNDRDTDDVTMGMTVHHFMEWLDTTDPIVQTNDEYIMAGRVSILLRGMANAFGLQMRVSDYWKEDAAKFLRSKGYDVVDYVPRIK